MEKGLRMYGGLEEGVEEVGRNEPLEYWSEHISISRKHFTETVERSDEYQQMFEDMLKKCNEGLIRERELEKQLRNEKQLVMKLHDDVERRDTKIADLNESLQKKEKEYGETYTKSVVNFMLQASTTDMKAKYDVKCRENSVLEMKNQLFLENEERLKEDVKSAQFEKKKSEEKFSDLKKEKDIADKEIKHLKLQQEELKRESRRWELKYLNESQLYKKLYLQNVLVRHKLSKVEDENIALKEQRKEKKKNEHGEMYTQSTVNAMLRVSTTRMKVKYDVKCRENAVLIMHNGQLLANEESLKDDLKSAKLEIKNAEEKFSVLRKQKDDTDNENKLLKLERDELKREACNWQTKYLNESQLYKNLYLENVLVRDKMRNVENEKLALIGQLQDAKEQLNIVNKDVEIAKETIEKEKSTAFKLEEENKDLAKLLTEHESRNEKLNCDLTTARKKNSTLQINNHEITETNKKVCDLNENLQRNLIGQQKKYNVLQNEFSKLRIANTEMEKILISEKQAKIDLEKANERIKECVNEIAHMLEEIKHKLIQKSCFGKLSRKKSRVLTYVQQIEGAIKNFQ